MERPNFFVFSWKLILSSLQQYNLGGDLISVAFLAGPEVQAICYARLGKFRIQFL